MHLLFSLNLFCSSSCVCVCIPTGWVSVWSLFHTIQSYYSGQTDGFSEAAAGAPAIDPLMFIIKE